VAPILGDFVQGLSGKRGRPGAAQAIGVVLRALQDQEALGLRQGRTQGAGLGALARVHPLEPLAIGLDPGCDHVAEHLLPGSMAVLGLVIEQPNDTVSHIGHCLGQRFTRARFARSTAHSSLPRLAHSGRVRRTHLERGNDRSLDRYEATTEGMEAFHGVPYSKKVQAIMREEQQLIQHMTLDTESLYIFDEYGA
jgi:hypothetical protein